MSGMPSDCEGEHLHDESVWLSAGKDLRLSTFAIRSRQPWMYLLIQAVPSTVRPSGVAKAAQLSEASFIGAMLKPLVWPDLWIKSRIESIANEE